MDARKLRESKELQQTEFWKRVSVGQSAGSRYEGGRTIPQPIQRLLTLAYGTRQQANRLFADLRAK